MSEEKKYTLDEARDLIAQEKCREHGHYFDVYTAFGTPDPIFIMCNVCGKKWELAHVHGQPEIGGKTRILKRGVQVRQ